MESTAELDPPIERAVDPYGALRDGNYLLYILGWMFSATGLMMLNAAVSWELYARTSSPMALGLMGLFVAVPVICFALPAGHIADTYDRRWILIGSQVVFSGCGLGLAAVSYFHANVWFVYGLLAVAGTARAFGAPARGAMFPQVVSDHLFQNAVTWNSFVFHLSATIGPLAAGAILSVTHLAWPVFLVSAAGAMIFGASLLWVRLRPMSRGTDALNWKSLLAGAGFLGREKTILAAISLDLFAVLFGGATSLMPIYALDILHVGPVQYGMLRAAPYVGAFAMAWILAHRPAFQHAGRSLLLAVAGFGGATIIFGLSKSFPLSLACLLLAGALDNISVVIRHVLVQVRTPNELRGRVSAVNTVFIDTSNELGGFESGVVAKYFSPVFSVVSGGIGTILVVLGIAALLPEIRRLRRIDEKVCNFADSDEVLGSRRLSDYTLAVKRILDSALIALACSIIAATAHAGPAEVIRQAKAAATSQADKAKSGRHLPHGFISKTIKLGNEPDRKYVIFVPPQYQLNDQHRWPFIVFLHGSGECGYDGIRQTTDGLPVYISHRPTKFPFIVLMPQAHQQWFRGPELAAVWAEMEATMKEYRIDMDRIYLTGLSMGGFAAWEMPMLRPDVFAATVPVCGVAPKEFMENIVHMPVWAFHGAQDANVPVGASRDAVSALRNLGGKPKYTEYPDLSHICWNRAYETPDLWMWLLSQKRAPTPRVIDYRLPGGASQVWWLAMAAEDKLRSSAHIHAELSEDGKLNVQSTSIAEWAVISNTEPIKPGDDLDVTWNGKHLGKGKFNGVFTIVPPIKSSVQTTSAPTH